MKKIVIKIGLVVQLSLTVQHYMPIDGFLSPRITYFALTILSSDKLVAQCMLQKVAGIEVQV